MKFRYLLIPLLTLITVSCNGVSESSSLSNESNSSLSDSDSTPTSVSDLAEIDYVTLNNYFGYDIYSLLPKIYSDNYDFYDDSSVDYPVDIYIDLFDWVEEDAISYDNLLQSSFSVDPEYGYVVQENTYCFVFLDEETYDTPTFSINLYTINESGTDPVNPDETVVANITSKYPTSYTAEIPDGSINEHLNIVNGPALVVAFAANASTTRTIFNNSSNEIRLYVGTGGNGGALIINSTDEVHISAITVNTSSNGGYKINGGPVVTEASYKTIFTEEYTSCTIQNVSTLQVRITSIEVELGGSLAVNPDIELPIGEVTTNNNIKSIHDYQFDTYGTASHPTVGAHNVLVVPIEIYGSPFPSNYLSNLELLFNGTSADTGWQSVSSYYNLSSYGNLDFTFDIATKFTTPANHNVSYYQGYEDYGDEYAIVEALASMDSTDFSQYDDDGDGQIDSVAFIYSAPYDYDYDTWWAWVFSGKYFEHHDTPLLDGKKLGYYMWASYDFMLDNSLGNSVTVNAETYIHEFGHLLGMPDLYNPEAVGPVGGWDMMDFNCGDHGPFNKLMYDWVDPLVAPSGYRYQVTLDSFSLDNDGQNTVLLIPYSSTNLTDGDAFDEYLLVMYYTPDGIYEGHLATSFSVDSPGIVIYHIDARLANYSDGWDLFMNNNEGTSNYLVEILEADKNNSLPSDDTLIASSDLLQSGEIDLASYYWNQGGSIFVNIGINMMTSTQATLTVDVY